MYVCERFISQEFESASDLLIELVTDEVYHTWFTMVHYPQFTRLHLLNTLIHVNVYTFCFGFTVMYTILAITSNCAFKYVYFSLKKC